MRRRILRTALLAAGLLLAGCNTPLRDLTPINAEQESLNTTKPFASAYKEKYPLEVQSVDDFYATWQGRIDKEKAAAPKP